MIKGSITISKPSYGCDEKKKISIRLRCKTSRITFVEAEIDYSDFVEALFGLAEVPVDLDVKELSAVGKKKHTQSHKVLVPEEFRGNSYGLKNNQAFIAWLKDIYSNENVFVNTDLGSKTSVVHEDNQVYVHISTYWFEDIKE